MEERKFKLYLYKNYIIRIRKKEFFFILTLIDCLIVFIVSYIWCSYNVSGAINCRTIRNLYLVDLTRLIPNKVKANVKPYRKYHSPSLDQNHNLRDKCNLIL